MGPLAPEEVDISREHVRRRKIPGLLHDAVRTPQARSQRFGRGGEGFCAIVHDQDTFIRFHVTILVSRFALVNFSAGVPALRFPLEKARSDMLELNGGPS